MTAPEAWAGGRGSSLRGRFFAWISLPSHRRGIKVCIMSCGFPGGFPATHSKKPTPERLCWRMKARVQSESQGTRCLHRPPDAARGCPSHRRTRLPSYRIWEGQPQGSLWHWAASRPIQPFASFANSVLRAGGHGICSGTGWYGVVDGPLWVPGAAPPENCPGESL